MASPSSNDSVPFHDSRAMGGTTKDHSPRPSQRPQPFNKRMKLSGLG
jgi:hypothetical protein